MEQCILIQLWDICMCAIAMPQPLLLGNINHNWHYNVTVYPIEHKLAQPSTYLLHSCPLVLGPYNMRHYTPHARTSVSACCLASAVLSHISYKGNTRSQRTSSYLAIVECNAVMGSVHNSTGFSLCGGGGWQRGRVMGFHILWCNLRVKITSLEEAKRKHFSYIT